MRDEPKEIIRAEVGQRLPALPAQPVELPGDKRIMILIDLEQDLQDRDNQGKGEQIQDGGKDVENNVQHQIPLIGGNETAQDAHEISHGSTISIFR